ncbi:MAG: ADOP family duplicated permease [Vicinamibacterales bacterium]
MSGLRAFIARLLAALDRDRCTHDLDDEVRAHLEMQAEEDARRGMTLDEARAAAQQRFGRVEPMRNDYRDPRSRLSLESILRDIRYSARLLQRSPGFAVMALLTLSIGIGATTAVFSLVNRAVLRPLPVDRPHELVALNNAGRRGIWPMLSYPNYVDYRDRNGVFAGLLAYRFAPIAVSSNGVNERLWGYLVSGNYFELLGVRPAVGRTITPREDEERGAHPVAVISYRFWQRRFGGDPGAIGRTLIVNGQTYTVVGVAPRGFFGTEVVAAPDLWFPLGMQAAIESNDRWLDDRRAENLFVIGRLAPSVRRPQAAAALDGIAAQLALEFPDVNEGTRVVLSPPGLVGAAMRGPVLGFTALLLIVAGLVLLVACVNLASLLLARAVDRRREVAIRLSIGAGRAALVRQLLVESLMLSSAAGAAGLVLAWWLMRAASAVRLPVDLPLVLDLPLDGRVLVFNVVLSIVTAAMFGLLPALQATKADLAAVLKDSASPIEPHTVAWRNTLIVVQVAASLVLLAGAGLMWRALGQTRTMALGFSTDGLLEVSFDLRLQGYTPAQGRQMQLRLLDAIQGLPGITNAALADPVPVDLHFSRARINAEGTLPERDDRATSAYMGRVTPGYFQTMRTRLEEGRDFTDLDHRGSTPVVIVNRSLARRLWPGQNALGRRLQLGGQTQFAAEGRPFEIVGIVEDGKYASFNDEGAMAVYRPLRQAYSASTTVVARTGGNVAAAIALVRAAVRDMDPNMPIASARTFDERLSVPLLPARVAALALASFGALALVLAAIGLYGVMSYSVSSRTHEIGVRMALGAEGSHVLRMVLGEGTRLVGIGIVAGVGVAALVTRLMRAILFGISPTDPLTYVTVTAVLFLVALLACWLPARRALRTDPLDALRST